MDLYSLFLTFISLITLILLLLIFVLLFYAMALGAPYAPVASHRIDTMVKLLRLKKGQKMVDLGSGDGRIVMAFARLGIESHGYEINPVLVLISRWKIRNAGLTKYAFIHFKDFWTTDLGKFDAVTLYGITHMMKRLGNKLKKDLKPGSKIASNYYSFPNLKLKKEENKVKLYISN